MKKKKVLFISLTELCVGGVSKVLMTIVEELHKEYCFDVVTLCDKPGYFDDAFTAYGGKIYRIPAIQYLEHKILYPLSFLQIKKAITQILKENKYDVIHGHSGWQDAACHVAAARLGLPVRISHGHGTYVWEGRNLVMRYYSRLTKNYIQKYANMRLACSSIAGDTLFSGASYENVLNPVDVRLYADVEKKPHRGIHLLQIGYFCERKNQIFSLNLLNYLVTQGVDVHLSLIGYPHQKGYYEQMLSLIAQHHLEEYISFLPHDFDKRTAFAQSDYCILPSQSEGLPLVALESQAAGIPCLMSNFISKDSDVGAGFFLPYNDLEKWAEFIINGVNIDEEHLKSNLQTISTQAYADKIRRIYEQKI